MSDSERIMHKLKMKTVLKNCLPRKALSPPSTYFSWSRVVKPNPAAAVKELLFTHRYCGAKREVLLLLLTIAEGGWRCPKGKPSPSPEAGCPDPGWGAGTALAPSCPLQDFTKAAGRPRAFSWSSHCPELVRHHLIPSEAAGVCCIS